LRERRAPGQDWNEAHLSEDPAVEVVQALGYSYIAPEVLEAERESRKEAILTQRLGRALKRLNPWLSDDNLAKAVRAITTIQAASLLDASEKVHTALTYGISLEQDRGAGKQGQTIRFFGFDDARKNELLATRQYRLQGTRVQIVPDVVLIVNGIPLAVIECKSPTLGDNGFHRGGAQGRRGGHGTGAGHGRTAGRAGSSEGRLDCQATQGPRRAFASAARARVRVGRVVQVSGPPVSPAGQGRGGWGGGAASRFVSDPRPA
jgi:hypothetical protein